MRSHFYPSFLLLNSWRQIAVELVLWLMAAGIKVSSSYSGSCQKHSQMQYQADSLPWKIVTLVLSHMYAGTEHVPPALTQLHETAWIQEQLG